MFCASGMLGFGANIILPHSLKVLLPKAEPNLAVTVTYDTVVVYGVELGDPAP